MIGPMRADRLLSILLLLQAHGQMSARTIAERLEISERTVYRDIDALSAAGVPVYTERGRQGGCALLPGYRTDVSGLTATEARALFVFAGGGTLKDLGLDQPLKAALRKLMASLPQAQRSAPVPLRPSNGSWSSRVDGCVRRTSFRTSAPSRMPSGKTSVFRSAIGAAGLDRRGG
jgi:predicted DNA-binding transcriptional regulator YafY